MDGLGMQQKAKKYDRRNHARRTGNRVTVNKNNTTHRKCVLFDLGSWAAMFWFWVWLDFCMGR